MAITPADVLRRQSERDRARQYAPVQSDKALALRPQILQIIQASEADGVPMQVILDKLRETDPRISRQNVVDALQSMQFNEAYKIVRFAKKGKQYDYKQMSSYTYVWGIKNGIQ